jgi:acetyltransferase-like isoleucine patch superfamily enzyme
MADPAQLPAPMPVIDSMVQRARREIDPPWKKILRQAAIFFIRRSKRIADIGEGFQWGAPLSLPILGMARIGRYVYVGGGGSIISPIVIGDFSMLAAGVCVVGNDHMIDVVGGPTRLEFATAERPVTIIEADCWIGQRATILEGVTIGRGAVVASASVVTKSVEPYSIVAGVPARPVRKRFSPDDQLKHDLALFGRDFRDANAGPDR